MMNIYYGEIFLIDGNYLSVKHVENVAICRRTLALTPKHHPAVELPWAIVLYYLLSLGIVVYNIYNNLQAQWDSTETNS